MKERTWQKLVTLDTLHWYYKGPEPIATVRHYDKQVRQRESIAYSFKLFSNLCLTLSLCFPWCKNERR